MKTLQSIAIQMILMLVPDFKVKHMYQNLFYVKNGPKRFSL